MFDTRRPSLFSDGRWRPIVVVGPGPSPEAEELLAESDGVLASRERWRLVCEAAANEHF